MAVEAVGKHQRRGCHSVNPLWLEASHWQQSVKVPVSTTYTTLRCLLSACEPGTVLSPGVKWGIACFEKFQVLEEYKQVLRSLPVMFQPQE